MHLSLTFRLPKEKAEYLKRVSVVEEERLFGFSTRDGNFNNFPLRPPGKLLDSTP